MKDLGDFLIVDSIRDENGGSKHFLEIKEFLKKYCKQISIPLGSINMWEKSGAKTGLRYGVVSGKITCVSFTYSKLEGPVYTWPEFQFMLNLERVLE